MAKSSSTHSTIFGVLLILLGFLLALAMAFWVTRQADTQDYDHEAAARRQISKFSEASTAPSKDLAEYLEQLDRDSGCDEHHDSAAMHQLRIEYKNHAKIAYGCGSTDATMFLQKTDGKWQTISPTNQFYSGIPLCGHVKQHGIPDVLYADGCFLANDDKSSRVIGKVVMPKFD